MSDQNMIFRQTLGIVSRSWQRIRRKGNYVGRVAAVLTLCAGFAAVGTGPAHAATDQEPVPGRNGQVVSLTQLHFPSYCANPNTRVYRMFYWSDGYELEAYVSEPKRPGKYPVVELLHGGCTFLDPDSGTTGTWVMGLYSISKTWFRASTVRRLSR
jgi:hypothetical protein